MPDLLPLPLYGDGLDAPVDLSAAQRTQDDLRRLLTQGAMHLDWGQRGVTLARKRRKTEAVRAVFSVI